MTDSSRPPGPERQGWLDAITSDDSFNPRDALSPGAFLDAGLPLALFTVVYAAGGRDLTLSLWVALGSGALLGVIRLLRREKLQNVIAGFIGLAIAAYMANRSGQAEDVFKFGLIINVTYGSVYIVSILARWPLLGVLVGFATGQGTSWRAEPRLMRAYMRASMLWVGLFAVRLAVQVPLYLQGEDQLGWLAGARLAMSWPLFLLVAYLSWVIIRPAFKAHADRSAVAVDQPVDGPVEERTERAAEE